MAIYLLTTLPADRARTVDQYPFQVVSAGSVADAREIAKSYRATGLSPTAWDNATVVELASVMGDDEDAYSGWTLALSIPDAPLTFNLRATGVLGVISAAIVSGGAGYSVSDVLTLAGGTADRAATFRVTSVDTGVVDGIELIDSGDYSVAPTGTQATTGGGGTGCTLGTLVASSASLPALLADMVGQLNARQDIAGAAVDMGASPILLTVSDASDALGDKTLEVSLLPPLLYDSSGMQLNNRMSIAGLVGDITDQGSASDSLTVEFPTQSSTVIPVTLLG